MCLHLLGITSENEILKYFWDYFYKTSSGNKNIFTD